MQIDWLTVTAQVLNFLVLVWLLKRLLYGPITRAMQRREKRIADRLEEAAAKRRDAEEEAARLQRQQAELREERERMLDDAREEASRMRSELEKEAREAIATEQASWRADVEKERAEFLRELRAGAVRHIHEVGRAALKDLGDADLEDQIAVRFARRLHELEQPTRDKLRRAVREARYRAQVESAFELGEGAREQVAAAVREVIDSDLKVEFVPTNDLILGIRLRAGGQVVEWSLSGYLDRLEEAVADKLAEVDPAAEPQAA